MENAWYSPVAQSSLRLRLSLYWTMGFAVTRFSSRVASATAPDTVTSWVLLPSLILPAPKTSFPFWKRTRARSLSTLSLRVKYQLPPAFVTSGWAGGSSVSVAVDVFAAGAVSSAGSTGYCLFAGRLGLSPGFLGAVTATGECAGNGPVHRAFVLIKLSLRLGSCCLSCRCSNNLGFSSANQLICA